MLRGDYNDIVAMLLEAGCASRACKRAGSVSKPCLGVLVPEPTPSWTRVKSGAL